MLLNIGFPQVEAVDTLQRW